MQAAETVQDVPLKPDPSPAYRRLYNSDLPPGYRWVILREPGRGARAVIEKLPRSGAGRAPKRPVRIPMAPFQCVALDRTKLEAALNLRLSGKRKEEPTALVTLAGRVFKGVGVKVREFARGFGKLFGRAG